MSAKILSFFIILFPARVWAASSDNFDLFFSGLKMFLGMAVFLGLMFLFYVLNQKGVKFLKKKKTGRINIVETRPVGGRKMLCLVEVRGQELLLGIGGDRIDFLHHIGGRREGVSFEDELKGSIEESP